MIVNVRVAWAQQIDAYNLSMHNIGLRCYAGARFRFTQCGMIGERSWMQPASTALDRSMNVQRGIGDVTTNGRRLISLLLARDDWSPFLDGKTSAGPECGTS